MTTTYRSIKRAALKSGLAPRDLLALVPQNDPFYVGAKRQLEKGEWFARVYKAMGSPPRCHIRRVHYWLVTTQAVPKPSGTPYENTSRDWDLLTLAAKYARYLGLVPIENIIDRRNREPYVYADYWSDRTPSQIRDSIDTDSIIEEIVSRFQCYNPNNTQPYMLEVWCEKSTMNDILEPICRRYGMNLVTGLGELSITSVYLLAGRIAKSHKPTRIFYVSDFDPAGECMPVSVARKIEYFVRQYDLNQDVKLTPIMLTAEQCLHYRLPRTPIKETEQRKEGFEARHGVGATELDALEALHSGEMARIIEEAIEPYFDIEVWNETIRRNREVMEYVRRYLVGGECPECEGSGDGKESYILDTVDGPVQVRDECGKCLGTGEVEGLIDNDIMTSLDTSPLDSYTPPRSDTTDDSTGNWLYDSGLDYLSQIGRYRQHQRCTSDPSKQVDWDDL